MRTIDIAVISVIATIVIVGVVTSTVTPGSKTGTNLSGEQKNSTSPSEPKIVSRVSSSEPAVMDSFGSPLDKVFVHDQVLLQSEITNKQDKRQSYVYIVQVKNANGITVSLSYSRAELPANDTLIVAQSWIPDAPGKYYVETFVWDNIQGQTVLTPTKKISVEVYIS